MSKPQDPGAASGLRLAGDGAGTALHGPLHSALQRAGIRGRGPRPRRRKASCRLPPRAEGWAGSPPGLCKALRLTRAPRARVPGCPLGSALAPPFLLDFVGSRPLRGISGAMVPVHSPRRGLGGGELPAPHLELGAPKEDGAGGRGQPREQGPHIPALSGTRCTRTPGVGGSWEVLRPGAPAWTQDGGPCTPDSRGNEEVVGQPVRHLHGEIPFSPEEWEASSI